MSAKVKTTISDIGTLLAGFFLTTAILLAVGCQSYKGGKVIDGTNFALGINIPGTSYSFNVVDYIGGVRVAGDEQTRITVINEVAETNSYFGCVYINRHSKIRAVIEPVETNAVLNALWENYIQTNAVESIGDDIEVRAVEEERINMLKDIAEECE